jgi:murein DD-endopeptidase MepM/ murein hydrolase activator NlpD
MYQVRNSGERKDDGSMHPYRRTLFPAFTAFFIFLFFGTPFAEELPWIEHPIKQGETLEAIADKYGVESSCIKWANEIQCSEAALEKELNLVPRDGALLIETLAEVRARRNGETTMGLYIREDTDFEPAKLTRLKEPVSDHPGFDGLLALARAEAPSTPFAPSRSSSFSLSWPVEGKVFSRFGPRRGRFHTGVDISAPRGTPIYAAAAGTVVRAAWRSGFGRSILIDHGNGVMTRYAHCDTMICKTGETVSAGQKIGTVGRSGRTTGPHLHFEVVIDGKHKDPEKHLPPRGN